MAIGRKTHKKRSVTCYERKVREITKSWQNSKGMQEKHPLDFYLAQLKKPSKGD